jgi:hypothetical protein
VAPQGWPSRPWTSCGRTCPWCRLACGRGRRGHGPA